jgi:hypothetical protein
MKCTPVLATLAFTAAALLGTTLAPASAAPRWEALFDGHGTAAFGGYTSPELPEGWAAVGNTLIKHGPVEDLVTHEPFANFELELDWKLESGGNSGIFYRGTREYDHIYWSAPEYQLLDDAHAPDGQSRLTAAGAAYGLYPAPAGVVKAAGHWNHTRLVVRGAHVEHWLNGRQIVSYELWSDDWRTRVAASKFAKFPQYGLAHDGVIGIQGDHDGTLTLRRIRVRRLAD